MPGTLNNGFISFSNLADKKEITDVYDNSSLTIKNGNKLGNIEFKHVSTDCLTATILDEENNNKHKPNNIIKKVKK